MNQFQLRVRGNTDGECVDRVRPVFVWKAPEQLTQFTIEMSKDSEFGDVIFLRDTHEHYCVYDNIELKPQTIYYVRVRSGMGTWSETHFATGK